MLSAPLPSIGTVNQPLRALLRVVVLDNGTERATASLPIISQAQQKKRYMFDVSL
jgi:hypothetical protein